MIFLIRIRMFFLIENGPIEYIRRKTCLNPT
uniref:Uncharacterized protein n=1 Tax=CrAss-like virus sp. ctDAq1 TaxID=2826822 RepID=A0A8S5QUD2_9CAUD|nr:MAG TPA: hypothetical protein [CrAss-like virus sp. ctDAq1]